LAGLLHAVEGAIEAVPAARILERAGDAGSAALLQHRDQARIGDHRELDDLAHAILEMAPGEGAEQAAVEQDPARRLEAAEAILAAVEIDAGLDAYRRIDVAHEGGRYLDVRHAAAVARGGKTDHVGQHAAADGDDGLVAAVDGKAVELAQHAHPGFGGLAGFSSRKDEEARRDALLREIGLDACAVMPVHALVDHHEAAPARDAAGQQRVVTRVEDIGHADQVVGDGSHAADLPARAVPDRHATSAHAARRSSTARATARARPRSWSCQ